MSARPGLVPRASAADALASTLRMQILDGTLAGGARLREIELAASNDAARHTVRAALRALAAEGLVVLEPHRGGRVALLGAREVRGLYELRTALEVEAARLALDRGDGRLPAHVTRAADRLAVACRRADPSWSTVVDAHEGVHAALVAASGSERLTAAHRALGGESRLFLVQLRPSWTLDRLADDHERLPAALEREGPDVLRDHLRHAADAVLARLE